MPRSLGAPVRPRFWPLAVVYLSRFWIPPAASHPQCLDFKPPFRPLRELQFCVMYQDFGCCDFQKDQELLAKYYRIMDRVGSDGHGSCGGFVLELLCQVGERERGPKSKV